MPLQLVTLPLYCARRRNNPLGLPSSVVHHRRYHTRRRFSPAFPTYLALVCIPRRSTRDFRGRLRGATLVMVSTHYPRCARGWKIRRGRFHPYAKLIFNFIAHRIAYGTKRRTKINIFFRLLGPQTCFRSVNNGSRLITIRYPDTEILKICA